MRDGANFPNFSPRWRGKRPTLSYAPGKVADARAIREVLRMLSDGASGKDTAKLCGLSERQVSRIRTRAVEIIVAKVMDGLRPKRRKYERPYTPEQRARKRGIVRISSPRVQRKKRGSK